MLQKDRSIEEVNAVIRYMKDLCKSYNTCIECPMNHNCNEQPAHWKEVKKNDRKR